LFNQTISRPEVQQFDNNNPFWTGAMKLAGFRKTNAPKMIEPDSRKLASLG